MIPQPAKEAKPRSLCRLTLRCLAFTLLCGVAAVVLVSMLWFFSAVPVPTSVQHMLTPAPPPPQKLHDALKSEHFDSLPSLLGGQKSCLIAASAPGSQRSLFLPLIDALLAAGHRVSVVSTDSSIQLDWTPDMRAQVRTLVGSLHPQEVIHFLTGLRVDVILVFPDFSRASSSAIFDAVPAPRLGESTALDLLSIFTRFAPLAPLVVMAPDCEMQGEVVSHRTKIADFRAPWLQYADYVLTADPRHTMCVDHLMRKVGAGPSTTPHKHLPSPVLKQILRWEDLQMAAAHMHSNNETEERPQLMFLSSSVSSLQVLCDRTAAVPVPPLIWAVRKPASLSPQCAERVMNLTGLILDDVAYDSLAIIVPPDSPPWLKEIASDLSHVHERPVFAVPGSEHADVSVPDLPTESAQWVMAPHTHEEWRPTRSCYLYFGMLFALNRFLTNLSRPTVKDCFADSHELPIRTQAVYKGCNPQKGEFFAEYFQDRTLLDVAFPTLTSDGVFIEAGAFDGVGGSNTAFYEKSRCWHGVCMEPTHHLHHQVVRRRECVAYWGALCKGHGRKEFVTVHPNHNFQEYRSALSGFSDTFSAKQQERLTDLEKSGDISVKRSEVLCYRLQDILYMLGISQVNLFALDVEGSEGTVLNAIDFDQAAFDLFLVEMSKSAEIKTLLEAKGFAFKGMLKYDGVFVRNDSSLSAIVIPASA